MRKHMLALACLAAAALPGGGMAGSYNDFENSLATAYSAYRLALFQSNTGNAEATTEAMTKLAENWVAVEADWGTSPPPQYVDDTEYPATLAAVTGIIAKASAQVAAGDLPKAHETLEALRGEIGALHERNGLIGFSDRMNAYHAVMEGILKQDLSGLDADGIRTLNEQAAVLAYLTADIVAHPSLEAPDPAYGQLLTAMTDSVGTLQAATRSGDPAAIQAAVAGLKPAYSKFFVRFG